VLYQAFGGDLRQWIGRRLHQVLISLDEGG
jgi:hypothetical protein